MDSGQCAFRRASISGERWPTRPAYYKMHRQVSPLVSFADITYTIKRISNYRPLSYILVSHGSRDPRDRYANVTSSNAILVIQKNKIVLSEILVDIAKHNTTGLTKPAHINKPIT